MADDIAEKIKYQRKVIGVERQLGFMYIPAVGQKLMPSENTKFIVHLEGETKAHSLSYNSEYKRLFGLTSWYKKNNIQTGDVLDIELDQQQMQVRKTQISEVELEDETEDEKPNEVDITGLSSAAKGNIVEDRIKELILLFGQGLLDVYKPVIDQGGIDLIVIKSGTFFPIYLQVKSRFNVVREEKLIFTVSGNTFKEHHSFYVVAVSFNPQTLEMDERLLFIPSKIVATQGIRLTGKNNIRVVASYKSTSQDQWSEYYIRKSELVDKLMEKFEEIEMYIK